MITVEKRDLRTELGFWLRQREKVQGKWHYINEQYGAWLLKELGGLGSDW